MTNIFKNKFKKRNSIAFKIIGLTLLIVLITIISLGVIVSNFVSKEVGVLTLDRNLEAVKGIKSDLGTYFDSVKISLEYLAEQDGFKLNSASVVAQDFEKLANDDEKFLGLYFATKDERVSTFPLYLQTELPTDYNPTNETWYKKAVEKDSIHWGQVVFDEENQELASVVSMPVKDYGKQIMGVISARVGLAGLADMVTKKQLGQKGYLFITDKNGEVIIHPDKSMIGKKLDFGKKIDELYLQDNGSLEYTIETGSYLASYQVIPEIKGIVFGQIPVEEAYQSLIRINKGILTFGIGAVILLIILISWLINRNLLRPLRGLSDGMQQVADNNLNAEVSLDRNDEIGTLAVNFNIMVERLREMISMIDLSAGNVKRSSNNLQLASDEVGQVSEQVSDSIQQVAVGADRQTENVDGIMVRIKELAKILKDLDLSNQEIKSLSAEMEGVTTQGSQGMKKVSNQMSNIKNSIQGVAYGIEELVSISNEIDSILEIINTIVEEINLLALNAAIEAARAGDAGRGFSVVADEIRNLADESSNSADKIKGLIGQIKEQTQNASIMMSEGQDEVKNGESIVQNTQQLFNKIQDSLQKVIKGISSSSDSIIEANNNSNEIVTNIEDIASISEETSASAEEVSAASQEQAATVEEIVNKTDKLSTMADDMYELISSFKNN